MKYKLILSFFFIAMLTWLIPGDLLAGRPLTVKVDKGEAVVSHLEGEVQVLPQGKDTWRILREKANLWGGDEIVVGSNSRLEITLAGEFL